MKNKGNIIVVSAPSGAGKTTICDAVIKTQKNVVVSISVTTRAPRAGEKNGRDYIFTDVPKFKKMIKQNKFVEWAQVHGHYYGTLKETLTQAVGKGKDILLDIDVVGGINIKKLFKNACLIFIMPPSIKELEKRLKARAKDDISVIKQRLINAKREIAKSKIYDYCVINDNLQGAISAVESIIVAQRYKNKKGV
ncbi:MAG: guanylate kinase [Elusimicrobia bacterium]|nr:guanylate kinase [Elusimicrobiota bacterium]